MDEKMTFVDLPIEVQGYLYWTNAHFSESQRVSYLENEKFMVSISLRSMGLLEEIKNPVRNAEKVFDFNNIDELIEESKQRTEEYYLRMESARPLAVKAMKEYRDRVNA